MVRYAEAKAGLARTLEDEALKIADRTVQQYYRQTFRDRLYQTFGRSQFGGKPLKGNVKKEVKPAAVPLARPVFSGEIMSYQILLATLINHPEIFDMVEEDFGHISVPNERLDLLRQTILNILGAEAGLDSKGLQDHLKEHGYVSELKAVLSEAVYTHAGFARPGASEEIVLSGWQETRAFMRKKAVLHELKEAGRALAADFSADNEERIMALHDVNKASDGKTGL